jgi:hypothetical protein
MLSAVDLDVAHVTTPPDSHCSLTVRALTAGAHAIVEKPVAMTTAETLALYDSPLLMPCFQRMTDVVQGGGLVDPMTQMLSQVATKKLRRYPGLRNFVRQFYDAVLRYAPVPVDRVNALSCARITDVAHGAVAS